MLLIQENIACYYAICRILHLLWQKSLKSQNIQQFTDEDLEQKNKLRCFLERTLKPKNMKQKKDLGVSDTLAKILEVGQSLLIIRDLNVLLQKITENVGTILGAEIVVLYQFWEKSQDVEIPPIVWGNIQYLDILEGKGRTVPHKESTVFKVLNKRRKKPIYATDAKKYWGHQFEEETWKKGKSRTFLYREDISSSAAVCLIAEDQRVGVLFVNYRIRHTFPEKERQIIEYFAAQAAIAIENSRLFEKSQKRIRDLEIVNEVGHIISTKLETKSLLQTIVDQIADHLKCTHCTIFLLQKENGKDLLVPKFTKGMRQDVMIRHFEVNEGIAGWVYQHGKSIVLDNANDDPHFIASRSKSTAFRSMLIAPVKVGDRTLGVISADQDEYGWFNEDDQRLVDALALVAGIAIERAIGLELLEDIGKQIISLQNVQNIGDMLRQILYGAIILTHTSTGVIYLVSDDGKAITHSYFPSGFEHPKPRLEKTESLTRTVIDSGIVISIPDIHIDPRTNPKLLGSFRSMIAVPLKIEKKVIGVLYLNDEKTHDFTETEISLLTTLANQAAIAIGNANLLTSKTKIITELSALKTIEDTITKTLDIDKILESVVDVVVQILGFDYAHISKVDFSKGMIGTVTGKGINVSEEFLNLAWHSLDSNDIQAWVVRNKQEIKLTGWDERLDKEIFKRFNHQNLVRVYLPILSHDAAYGTLEAGYQKDNHQDILTEEIEILRKVVTLAGIGLDQAHLRKEQQKLLNQLQALNQASVYIQSSRTEEEAVNQIFKCLERIGYSKGMLSLVNEATGNIEGRYALGENWRKIKDETKRELKGNDILAVVIREKRSIFSKDCYTDPLCDQQAVRSADIRSQYVIPLIVNEQAIGTLQVDLSDKQGLVTGSEDILLSRMGVLETFASQIAIVIRNVKDRQMINFLETTLTETAHEFRSPLHNILTQIGGLKSYLPADQEKANDVNEIFKIIAEEAHRAKRQMENTLMFTDRSRTQMGFNFEPGYIQEVIQLCVNNYRLRALERGIAIVIKDNVKRLPKFKFDKCKIEQVINNLVDNAIKYSHYNRVIQIQGYDDNNWVHIDIWDKGLGIPESEFDNIFKGFTRGSPKDKKRYIPGTGLGLKISKEIITGHGGKIKVKSTPFFDDPRRVEAYEGYDTIFTIILPKTPQEK